MINAVLAYNWQYSTTILVDTINRTIGPSVQLHGIYWYRDEIDNDNTYFNLFWNK